MNRILIVPVVTGLLALAACSSASTAAAAPPAAASSSPIPSTPSAASTSAPTLPPPPTPVTLGPLTLADFPSTEDGNLARGVCDAWDRLREKYATLVATDSPDQLNQWFSGPAWHTAWSNANSLGDDPAYSHLETAFGLATYGDAASVANARLMDKACTAGN